MTEPSEQATKPPRTWRPMAAGSAAILLALGLAWFIAAVVVPVWKTRKVVSETAIARKVALGADGFRDGSIDVRWWVDPDVICRERVAQLGSQEEAVRLLSLYLNMPDRWATDKDMATTLLGNCGIAAVPALEQSIAFGDPSVRTTAAEALKKIRGEEVKP